jgi:cell wall assembly regulator SMI1
VSSGSPVLGEMLPGLAPEQVQTIAADVPFELGPDLATLYGWHNGTTDTKAGVAQLFPGGLFLSLESAVSEYLRRVEAARRVTDDERLAEEIHHPMWFPLFLDAGGNVHVVIVGSGADSGTVWFVPLEEPELRYKVASGLADMIDFVVTCYEHGAYFIRTDNGRVDEHHDRTAALARARTKPEPKVTELAREVASDDPDAAARAFDTIKRLRFPEAVLPLIEVLDDDHPPARRRAALLLGILSDHRAVPALAAAMTDPDSSVREAAGRALDSLRGLATPEG